MQLEGICLRVNLLRLSILMIELTIHLKPFIAIGIMEIMNALARRITGKMIRVSFL